MQSVMHFHDDVRLVRVPTKTIALAFASADDPRKKVFRFWRRKVYKILPKIHINPVASEVTREFAPSYLQYLIYSIWVRVFSTGRLEIYRMLPRLAKFEEFSALCHP